MARIRGKTTEPGRLRTIGLAIVPVLVFATAAGSAMADQIFGYLEFVGTDTKREDEQLDGTTVESETRALFSRFNFVFDKRFYPNFRLQAGGFFERLDSSLELQESDTVTTAVRPYANLTLRNTTNLFELGWIRDQRKVDPSGASSTTDVRETGSAIMAFYPDKRSTYRFQFNRTNVYDKNRLLRDTTEDLFQLIAEAGPVKPVQIIYRGSLTDRTDKLTDTEIQNWSHVGRVVYDDQYFKQRVRLNSDYRFTYQSTETTSAQGGEVRFPLFRFAGLSAVDDEVMRIVLGPNPSLIDGDRNQSAGIDIGKPVNGLDDTPRQMAVDLASASELNTLLVWVDREIAQETADDFVWDVYTSANNEDWSFHARVTQASFSVFVPQFEVRFPAVTTRYIKVVTTPVAPTDPTVTDPSILVTELEAELVLPTADVQRNVRSRAQVVNLRTRTRILNTPNFFHELTYLGAKAESGPLAYNLRSGFSVSHALSPVYSISARLQHENDRRSGLERDGTLFTASLTAQAIETFEQRLVINARNDSGTIEDRDIASVFLFNILRIYPGVNVQLTLGKASARTPGQTSLSDDISVNSSFSPHRTLTMNVIYRDRRDTTTFVELPTFKGVTNSSLFSVAYNPLATLYLFGSYRTERRPNVPRRSFQNFSIAWTPFRDGTLQLSLRYAETFRSQDESRDRNISPRLRWNFRRGSFLDIVYTKQTTERLVLGAASLRSELESLSGNLRFAF